jgi:glycosyltransferase involved in cell wall biosynthesis
MRVLIIGSDREHCGIAEHTRMLGQALGDLGVAVAVLPPRITDAELQRTDFDLLHVNHQASLHSQWTPDRVRFWSRAKPTLVTQHDTFEDRGIMAERELPDFVNSAHGMIVHEQVDGMTAPRGKAALFRGDAPAVQARSTANDWVSTEVFYLPQGIPQVPLAVRPPFDISSDAATRPFLGTVGFPFPWKNHRELVALATVSGWGSLVIAPGASPDYIGELSAQSAGTAPLHVVTDWLSMEQVVAMLRQCWATAFLYQTGNSGTSAAIRLGISAGLPVLAYNCRQFGDLREDPLGQRSIIWCDNGSADLLGALESLDPREDEDADRTAAGWAAKVKVLAQRDSWANVAQTTKAIYERLIKRKEGRV